MRRWALAASLPIMLAACGGPTEGTVVDRTFQRGSCQSVVSYGANGSPSFGMSCTSDMWMLVVKTPENKTEPVEVRKATWAQHPEGSYWRKGG